MDSDVLKLIQSFTVSSNPKTEPNNEVLENVKQLKKNEEEVQSCSCSCSCSCEFSDLLEEKTSPSCSFSVLVFSKDRPYQLYLLLTSMKKFFLDEPVKICVIYTSTKTEWLRYYEAVFKIFSKIVFPILESSFVNDVDECFNKMLNDMKSNFILFCVDDIIFYNELSVRDSAKQLNENSDMYGIHLKLHPGIHYSHAGSCASMPPPFAPLKDCDTVLGFNFRSASGDWAYPFDLCACLYRLCDIQLILSHIKSLYGQEGYANPNVLEVSGNEVMNKNFQRFIWGGCMTRPVCSVVTVNIVQSTYDVPIYDSRGGDLSTLNSNLIPYLETNSEDNVVQLNFSRYKNSNYNSVHIGDLYLLNKPKDIDVLESSPVLAANSEINVSVVLPVFNGGDFIHRCLQSLVEQECCNFEVVCVLNGCTDNSEAICSSFQETFAARNVSFNIIVVEEKSLSLALNLGVSSARGNYICRIDVDDFFVSSLHLYTLMNYLDVHTSINVVGTHAFLKSGPQVESLEIGEDCIYSAVSGGIPTHRVLVQWEMIFRCVVLHPSVMFRKEIIEYCGSYEKDTCVEDYLLWSRVLKCYPFSVTNLPHVNLCIYQHSKSKSTIESNIAKCEGVSVQWSLAKLYLSSEDLLSISITDEMKGKEILGMISHPTKVTAFEDVRNGCRLLWKLYDSFKAAIPGEYRTDDVTCLLKKSKEKIASSFLSECSEHFRWDDLKEEICALEINPTDLIKHQLIQLI